MKIFVLPLAFTLAMAATGAARPDVIMTARSHFKAIHDGGSVDHLHAIYIGSVDATEWEEAARLTPIRPSDELWCHWKIQSRIARSVYSVQERGVERALDTMPSADVWFFTTIYGQGRPSQGCSSSTSRFQSDYVQAVSGLTHDFNKVVDDDKPNAQRSIRANIPDISQVELDY
jgi:hypothetical protein